MDQTTRCLHCGKRLVPMPTSSGRTELTCIRCVDPMKTDRWANSPLAKPPVEDPAL